MQDCFRLHPEVYGDELDGDGDESSQDATNVPEGAAEEGLIASPVAAEATQRSLPDLQSKSVSDKSPVSSSSEVSRAEPTPEPASSPDKKA
jgi:hypothetical protein